MAEGAERQPVAPRSRALGRVRSHKELVVDVDLQTVDHQRRAGRVLGRQVVTDRPRPRPAGRHRSVTVPHLHDIHTSLLGSLFVLPVS